MSISDIIDPVFARASYMSRCMLRECCRAWAEFRPPRVREFVSALIPANILAHIDACGGVIVGGCALACVNGDDFGDIDVLFTEVQNIAFKSVLGKLNAKLIVPGRCNEADAGELECKYFVSRKYELYGYTINTIETKLSVGDYLGTFDFDFCKVAISGNALMISRPDSVISRRSEHRFTGDVGILFYKLAMGHRACERVAKYTARGYTVAHADVDELYAAHIAAVERARAVLAAGGEAGGAGGAGGAIREYVRGCAPIQAVCKHDIIDIIETDYQVYYRIRQVFGTIEHDVVSSAVGSLPRFVCRNCLTNMTAE